MPRKSFSRLVSDTHFCHCQSRHASRSLVALRLVRHLVQHEGPSTLVVLGANSCTRPGDGPCSRNHCKSVPACPDALGGYVVMFAQSLGMEHARDSDCHRLIDSILCVGMNIECMGTLSSFLENENSETIKATGIMGLWHMEVIWPIKLTSEEDLQNKHTIFDKVTGETIYNILKLEEALVDENDRPLYSPKLMKTIILNNPFSDIIPRIIGQESEEVKDNVYVKFSKNLELTKAARIIWMWHMELIGSIKPTLKGDERDFNLLSFSEEAEEDEEAAVILNKKFSGNDKSAHDHLSDPKLSTQ
ncbi:Peptidyl-prolyl cis-trans isomerase CWC27 like protein [Eufriesea mexicana]|nr:Peptidyl-prolyl cis-trans isomerase CWC27 like protein [Eufriesea mexicana]